MKAVLRRLKNAFPDRHPVRLAWHKFKAIVAAIRYGFPALKLKIIGITGTDGKTTTVAMTAHILHEAGVKVGAVSTSFYRIGEKTEENPTHKTSLSPFTLQKFLRRCVKAGCSTVVVEASSHGLVQHRLDFLSPSIAAITNISPEHLDYHKSMEQYRADKSLLFRMLRPGGVSILNADDETFEDYRTLPAKWRISWSSSHSFATARDDRDCAFWASDVHEEAAGLRATIQCNADEDMWELQLRIPGVFNLENALCAISCAHAAGIDVATCVDALKNFGGVPGRMERIDEGQPFAVYVDFTVTPRAYEKTLAAIRATLAPGARLLVLTGSCGNRMPEKRTVIGKVVSELADVVVVSEDETITEDPQKVIDEVWAGIDQHNIEAKQIFDRREGIRYLLKNARPGDAVALCGMGACTTMQTRQGLRPWDERVVAREELRALRR
jgi:UDP-N-acetylmuramoyl-L-alanyl-D-glutamate--2,6-diaminopimelate ligase